eukprot:2115093-Pleurochrysis_carterae.AAC.1
MSSSRTALSGCRVSDGAGSASGTRAPAPAGTRPRKSSNGSWGSGEQRTCISRHTLPSSVSPSSAAAFAAQ